ncbi:hypothetical protein O6H91_09G108500 [Diphasiastrum complanatum]|uniref:Uncharacterized protein n=1 Tax=Diphasiastrum complanatum TaxID=34168 RepID=A0ACC2CSX4_DIPCM|nr:hypothetical protein O6H91_09G108500 [Diphasiastrum complanatum]
MFIFWFKLHGICALMACELGKVRYYFVVQMLLSKGNILQKRENWKEKKLPLLRSISLDVCDAINDGYDTPHETAWQSLCMVKFARCTLPRHSFKSSRLQSKDLEYMPFGYCHNSTIVLERTKCSLHTTIVKERL